MNMIDQKQALVVCFAKTGSVKFEASFLNLPNLKANRYGVHRFTSSGMLHCVDWYRIASVLKALSAAIVTTILSKKSFNLDCLTMTILGLRSSKRRSLVFLSSCVCRIESAHAPPHRQRDNIKKEKVFISPQNVTSQNLSRTAVIT